MRLLRLSMAAVLLTICAAMNGFADKEDFRYRVKVWFDPAGHRMEAEVRITNPPASKFYLQPRFEIRELALDGKQAAFRRDDSPDSTEYRYFGLPYVVEGGGVRELRVSYGGEMPDIINNVNMISPDLVELALYSAWYPLFEGMRDFTFEMEIDLPEGFSLTTNGRLKKQWKRGDRAHSRWVSHAPGWDMMLLASPILRKIEGGGRSARVEMFYHDLPEQSLRAHMDSLTAGMDRLTVSYGSPRVKGIVRFAYSPRRGWGYSRIPVFVVAEDYARKEMEKEYGEARIFHGMCHEMAHFWWLLANTDSPEDWINEGLAEYSAFRLSERRYGNAFGAVLREEYRDHAASNRTPDSIVETQRSSPDSYLNRYERTTLMFLEARDRFGEESLDRLLKQLNTRFSGTHDLTTVLFLEEAEKQMGRDARDFFHETLYRKWEVARPSK